MIEDSRNHPAQNAVSFVITSAISVRGPMKGWSALIVLEKSARSGRATNE